MNPEMPKLDVTKLYITNFQQFHKTCMPQEFSFLIPIMKYIWTNPSSPKVYQKLINCCKLFFIKNPILVLDSLHFSKGKWGINKEDIVNSLRNKAFKKIFDKAQIKIWITEILNIFTGETYLNISLTPLPKIYRFDAKKLELYYKLLSYDDLKFLSAGVKVCGLYHCTVKYDNGEIIALEDIVKLFSNCLLKIYYFFIHNNYYNNPVCKNYAKLIDACNKVGKIELKYIPHSFNILDFYKHLKKSNSRALISLHLRDPEPRLLEISNEIFQTDVFDFIPPIICSDIFWSEEILKLAEIQKKVAASYGIFYNSSVLSYRE